MKWLHTRSQRSSRVRVNFYCDVRDELIYLLFHEDLVREPHHGFAPHQALIEL